MSDLDFLVLGPFEVMRDGRPVALGTPKARQLLATLVLEAGRSVTIDTVIDELWGDQPPSDAAGSIQTYVSRLRTALGDRSLLETRGTSYRLAIERDRCDAARFEDLARLGAEQLAAAQDAQAAQTLRDALALWRGSALEDVGGPRAQAEAVRLEELRLGTIEHRIEAELVSRSPAELAAELEVLTGRHPLRERFWALRMRALYRAGRQAEALAAYDACRERLVEELGIDPSEELRAVHDAILHQDDSRISRRPVSGVRAPLTIDVRGPSATRSVDVEGPHVTIGRADGNTLVLDDPLVSSTHAALEHVGTTWFVRDLSSRNGTKVNGEVLTGQRAIGPTDEIRVGRTVLVCSTALAGAGPTIAVSAPPDLDDVEYEILAALCRAQLRNGSVGRSHDIAGALGREPRDVEHVLAALAEKFGLPDGIGDRDDLLASLAVESGAVRPSDLA